MLLLTTPNRISVTRNRGTKLKFIASRHPDQRFLRQLNHGILHFAVGQGIQGGNGTIDCFARLAYRICQSIRTDDIIVDFLKIAAICIFQSSTHIVRNLFGTLTHQINQRQSRFSFRQIVADVFAGFFGFARIVQHIVNNLECRTDIHTVVFQRPFVFGGSLAQNCADLRRRFKQFCRFILDDLDILFFGNVRIADVHQLHDFALGNNVGCIRHHFQNAHTARGNHQLKGARV
ncbi:hypothetical protein NM271_2180 [Neisseria meningitidis NM271]|nr:hypothetical protein NM271_2180 [Neisseria meningitidis NM271]